MLLQELFQPASIKWIHGPDTRQMDGEAAMNVNGKTYHVAFEYSEEIEGCDIFFDQVTETGGLTHEVTGTGDAFEVFGGVLTAIREFVEKTKPYYLRFSSKEPSRTSLYSRMLKRFLPPRSEVTTSPGFRGSTDFLIRLRYNQ